MNSFTPLVRREIRVEFSLTAQSLWFRVLKWCFSLPLMFCLWPSHWFWPVLLTVSLAALVLHCFYRWKTAAWPRPCGGWNDLKTAVGFR